MSEERLRQVTVGGAPSVLNSQITLVEYDPAWPPFFEREARRIVTALGSDALRVEHVGSMSVPGLIAKPSIDVVLVVADSTDEASYVPRMEAAGYALRIREPDWFEHRMFNLPGVEVKVHVFSLGCPEVGRMLAFRDRLRSNSLDRERYAEKKRELAQRTWKYGQDYADAMTDIIRTILERLESTGMERGTDILS